MNRNGGSTDRLDMPGMATSRACAVSSAGSRNSVLRILTRRGLCAVNPLPPVYNLASRFKFYDRSKSGCARANVVTVTSARSW